MGAQTFGYADKWSISASYDPLVTNMVAGNTVALEGGSTEIERQYQSGFALVGDFAGMNGDNLNQANSAFEIMTITGGPRFNLHNSYRRVSAFGQVLAGGALGRNGVFPVGNTIRSQANALAVQAGGGFEYFLSKYWTLRAGEVNWVRTSLPNSATNTQNSLRLGIGIRYRIQ